MEELKTVIVIEDQINTSKLHKEILSSNFIESFVGLQIVENELKLYGNTILNDSSLNALISAHNPVDPLTDEIQLYYKRQDDGKKAIIQIMSELRLNSQVLNLPRSVNKEIEKRYWDVAIAINNGWWITAKERAEMVVVADVVTQDLYDNILAKINGYIALNY